MTKDGLINKYILNIIYEVEVNDHDINYILYREFINLLNDYDKLKKTSTYINDIDEFNI